VVVPLIAAMEGISLRDLATAQKTEYILVLQTLETVQGVAVIWACVRKFQPLPPDLFRLDGCVRTSRVLLWRSACVHLQVQAIFSRERLAGLGFAELRRGFCGDCRRCGCCFAV